MEVAEAGRVRAPKADNSGAAFPAFLCRPDRWTHADHPPAAIPSTASPARRSHEGGQPSGSLVIVREPSALTLTSRARALQLLIGEVVEISTRLDHVVSVANGAIVAFEPRLKMNHTLVVHIEVPACSHGVASRSRPRRVALRELDR